MRYPVSSFFLARILLWPHALLHSLLRSLFMSVPQTVKVLWCKLPRRTSMPWQDFLSSTSGTFQSHCLQTTFIPISSRQMVGQRIFVLWLLLLFQQLKTNRFFHRLEEVGSVPTFENESCDYDGRHRSAQVFL